MLTCLVRLFKDQLQCSSTRAKALLKGSVHPTNVQSEHCSLHSKAALWCSLKKMVGVTDLRQIKIKWPRAVCVPYSKPTEAQRFEKILFCRFLQLNL